MSLTFIICFIAMLGSQAITIPGMNKQVHEDYRWGFYLMKFIALPLWFASAFAGSLGIIPGLGLILLVFVVGFIGMVAVMFLVFSRDPSLATEIQDKSKDNILRSRFMNYFSASWGGLLLAGTLGALAM